MISCGLGLTWLCQNPSLFGISVSGWTRRDLPYEETRLTVGIHILEMVSNINSISDREHQPIKRLSFELQGERTGKDTTTKAQQRPA
jgi:hypothetical protein